MIRHYLLIFVILIVNFSEINSKPQHDSICNSYYGSVIRGDGINVLECEIVELIINEKAPYELEQWKLDIKVSKLSKLSPISLNLQRTDSLLADNYTPVWFGLYNDFPDDIDYEQRIIKTAAPNLGEFTIFQNYEQKAAMIVFSEESDWIVEGFFGNNLLKYDARGYYVLLKVTFPIDGLSTKACSKKCKAINETLPISVESPMKIVYPEILVVLDWDSVKDKITRDVIKNTLIYFNAVDMLFSAFVSPKIRLSIAGIIIPRDSFSTPYFKKREVKLANDYIGYNAIHDNLRIHFMEHSDVFPMKNYDIIMGMSNVQFCDADGGCDYFGVSYQSVNCQTNNLNKFGPIVGAVRHPDFQGRYSLMAKEIAHMFGSNYVKNWQSACCNGIMSEFVDSLEFSPWPLKWSQCAITEISRYFSNNCNDLICMYNKPERLITTNCEKSSPQTTTEVTTKATTTEATTHDTTTEITTETTTTEVIPETTTTEFTTEITTTEITAETTTTEVIPETTTTEFTTEFTTTEITAETTTTEVIPEITTTEFTTEFTTTEDIPETTTIEVTTAATTTEVLPETTTTEVTTEATTETPKTAASISIITNEVFASNCDKNAKVLIPNSVIKHTMVASPTVIKPKRNATEIVPVIKKPKLFAIIDHYVEGIRNLFCCHNKKGHLRN